MFRMWPLRNEIDFRLLIIKSIDRIPSDLQEKLRNYFVFCIFIRRFTLETSRIAESSKSVYWSVRCLEKAYLRVKVDKINFEICKRDVIKLL